MSDGMRIDEEIIEELEVMEVGKKRHAAAVESSYNDMIPYDGG